MMLFLHLLHIIDISLVKKVSLIFIFPLALDVSTYYVWLLGPMTIDLL